MKKKRPSGRFFLHMSEKSCTFAAESKNHE